MSEKKTSQFLPSLYQMCNKDDQTHRECITWSDEGTSFWVSNIEQFSRMILPMYFKHNNYASFVRQLNMYGFHRSTEPRGKVEPGASMIEHFTHEFFIRGREDLLANIHRKTSSNFTKSSKVSVGRGLGKAFGVGPSTKEAKHVQQQINEQDEARRSMQDDVDVLKKNQMQLANTIQVLHQQNITLQQEMQRQADRLDSVISSLTGHQVELEQEAVKRRRAVALDREKASRLSASQIPGQAPGVLFDSNVYQIEDDAMDLQSMDLDTIFNTVGGPSDPQQLQDFSRSLQYN